jgi:hypothetical protein
MSKMTSAFFTACAWVVLLGVIATAVLRASIEAKERRTERNSHIVKSSTEQLLPPYTVLRKLDADNSRSSKPPVQIEKVSTKSLPKTGISGILVGDFWHIL